MKHNLSIVAAAMMLAAPLAWAQPQDGPQRPPHQVQPPPGPMPGQPGHPQPPDPFGGSFFPPEMLMHNQKAIGLTDEQKTAITDEIKKAQSRFTDLQWQMQSEQEAMAALVKEDRVDEQKVMAQLDKILGIESEVKKTHLGLLIRIKNQLTAEQQAKLRELKNQRRPPMGPRASGGPPAGGPRPGGEGPVEPPPGE